MMFRSYYQLIICFLFASLTTKAQHIYYKHVENETLMQFSDTSKAIVFLNKDSLVDYTNHFKYIQKFFPTIQYQQITIVFKHSQQIARSKPTFMCFFQSPEKRKYKIYLSDLAIGAIDSVTLKHLDVNAQLGLIARQMGHIYEFSTDGFFDLLAWHFKQLSRKAKRKMEYDNELKIIEAGCGYQLLALSQIEEERLNIDNWKDSKAYAKYVKNDKNKYMSPSVIRNFISDMPIYVSKQYK